MEARSVTNVQEQLGEAVPCPPLLWAHGSAHEPAPSRSFPNKAAVSPHKAALGRRSSAPGPSWWLQSSRTRCCHEY